MPPSTYEWHRITKGGEFYYMLQSRTVQNVKIKYLRHLLEMLCLIIWKRKYLQNLESDREKKQNQIQARERPLTNMGGVAKQKEAT